MAYQDSDCTRVSVSHGKVAIHRPGAGQLQWIEGGQNWRLDAQGAHRLAHMDMDAMAWTEGLIVTQDMRLSNFLAQVSRYRHGYLGCSNEIADLRLSGCSASKTRSNCFGCYRRRCPYDFVGVHAGGCM